MDPIAVSAKTAAAMLGISVREFHRSVRKHLTARRLSRRGHPRYSVDEIREWFESRPVLPGGRQRGQVTRRPPAGRSGGRASGGPLPEILRRPPPKFDERADGNEKPAG